MGEVVGEVVRKVVGEVVGKGVGDGAVVGTYSSALGVAYVTVVTHAGGAQARDGGLVVAFYVNNRPQYFRQALGALQAVEGRERISLLLVSLDSVSAEMIALAEALGPRVARMRLLFHPVRADLVQMEALLAIKEHWMWLQDQIWGGLPETQAFDGHVLLLEEDHLVSPDYLQVMEVLVALKASVCPQCWAVCAKYGCREPSASKVLHICRSSAVINSGIALNRSIYRIIKRSDWLDFADGWDWTLFHLAQTGQMPDGMLAPAVSRMRNIGLEGATVNSARLPSSARQLDFPATSTALPNLDPSAFLIESSVDEVYVPPAQEPLYIDAGVGFIAL